MPYTSATRRRTWDDLYFAAAADITARACPTCRRLERLSTVPALLPLFQHHLMVPFTAHYAQRLPGDATAPPTTSLYLPPRRNSGCHPHHPTHTRYPRYLLHPTRPPPPHTLHPVPPGPGYQPRRLAETTPYVGRDWLDGRRRTSCRYAGSFSGRLCIVGRCDRMTYKRYATIAHLSATRRSAGSPVFHYYAGAPTFAVAAARVLR